MENCWNVADEKTDIQ